MWFNHYYLYPQSIVRHSFTFSITFDLILWKKCKQNENKTMNNNNNTSVNYLGHIFGRTRTQWVILFLTIFTFLFLKKKNTMIIIISSDNFQLLHSIQRTNINILWSFLFRCKWAISHIEKFQTDTWPETVKVITATKNNPFSWINSHL